MFRYYPYEELYFLEGAKKVRDRVNCQMIYIGGCTDLASVEQVMNDAEKAAIREALETCGLRLA